VIIKNKKNIKKIDIVKILFSFLIKNIEIINAEKDNNIDDNIHVLKTHKYKNNIDDVHTDQTNDQIVE
jgi:hypothetical protein